MLFQLAGLEIDYTGPAFITKTAATSVLEANMAKSHKVVVVNNIDTNISVSKLKMPL